MSDQRIFEDAPSDPSTPSLGAELASVASADVRARAVARKRHGYGLAQGDVLLNEPATASSTVKKAAEVAFANAGYRTVDASDTSTTAPTVRIDIKGFWLWLEPGVMVGTIRSRIRTEVALGSSVPLTITAETFQPGQIFSEEAWTNAVAKAITEFTTLLSTKIAALKS